MRTATRLCSTEQWFNKHAADLQREFPDSFEREDKEAEQFFGSRTTIAVSRRGTYASWTLWRGEGKLCTKRTSLKSFGMVEGKRVPVGIAMWYIRNATAR